MGDITAAEIKALMHEVLDEQRRNFWVEPEQHFLDHDMIRGCRIDRDVWRENHKFITEIRQAGATVKKVSLVALVTALCGIVGYCIKLVWGAVLAGAE